MGEYKFIHDTVHGSIRVDSFLLELMETPELQRLSGIRQLGFSYLVFPGANHTRLEHSLGTCHVAKQICRALGIKDDEEKKVAAAALLHDVGHGPYSHTLESLFHNMLGIDHAELTKRIITGDYDIVPHADEKFFAARKTIPEILEKHGLKPEEVAALVTGGEDTNTIEMFGKKVRRGFSAKIIHSAIDADQIDYLLRDSHYTGVAYGTIDLDRLLQTLTVFRDQLVVHEKGISAVESILVARALMYSSVYFHKTVRIAELMLARAVETAVSRKKTDSEAIQKMTDSEITEYLLRSGTFERDIVLSLKYRSLFKRAFAKNVDELDDDQKTVLAGLADYRKRMKKERELCSRAGIPSGYAIVDLPAPELLLSEPRISKVDVKILTDGGKLRNFSSQSPLSSALKLRNTVKWVVMVSAHRKYREKVRKAAEKVIFS